MMTCIKFCAATKLIFLEFEVTGIFSITWLHEFKRDIFSSEITYESFSQGTDTKLFDKVSEN